MKDKIAVVIVNYHCQDLVCRCLESIVSLGRDDLSFIIVDNSETPDTDRIQLLHPAATVLRPGSNLGFGGGNNIGIKHALDSGVTHVMIMNPDTTTETDFFPPLLEAFAKYPRLGMVGPKILYHNSPHQIWSAGGTLNWWIGRPANVYNERYSKKGNAVPVQFLSGCAMLLRAEAVRQVGLMDDRYFLYFEDADYTQRFLRAGWGVA